MRTASIIVLAGLVGCWGQPAADPPRPSGDVAPPDEEFRLAHAEAARLQRRLTELRAVPGRPSDAQFAEQIALGKALSAAQRQAGRLGHPVGTAEPHTPLGADALFACLTLSTDPPSRTRPALDLLVRHHPDDPRLGDYLLNAFGDDAPGLGHAWLGPVLDRLLAATADPGVRAVARAGRGRLLLLSADPAEVTAGLWLLAEVVRDADGGRAVAWADKLLADHGRPAGGTSSPNVRLAP